MAEAKSKAGGGRWILIMVFISFIACAILIVYFISSEESSEYSGVSVRARANPSSPTTTGKEATTEYIDQMSLYAKQKAKEAKETGKTYVSPIIKGAKLRTWDEMTPNKERSKPPEKAKITHEEPVEKPRDPAADAERDKILLGVISAWRNEGHVDSIFEVPEPKNIQTASRDSNNSSYSENPLVGLIDVGDRFYSTIDFNVNTDFASSGFIISTVLSGKLRGAQFFGRFSHVRKSRWGESLTIEYDQLVLKDGTVSKIQATAIDPKLASPTLSHDTDHHYVYRWGSLFVGSLLKGWEGFTKATSQSGSQTTAGIGMGGGSVIRSSPEYSVTDRALIGSGEMAKELASAFGDNFNRPNTIRLFASHMGGKPVSIIVTDIGTTKGSQSQPSTEDEMEEGDNRQVNHKRGFKKVSGLSQKTPKDKPPKDLSLSNYDYNPGLFDKSDTQ